MCGFGDSGTCERLGRMDIGPFFCRVFDEKWTATGRMLPGPDHVPVRFVMPGAAADFDVDIARVTAGSSHVL